MEDKVWVYEYLKNLFSGKEYNPLADIWEKVSKFGGKLYKYYSFEDEYALENLKNGVVHFSKPERFNDPFDCAIGISLESIIEAYLPTLIDQNIKYDGNNEQVLRDCVQQILFDDSNDFNSKSKEAELIALLLRAPSFQKLIPKMLNKEQISEEEQRQAVFDAFSDSRFSKKYFEILGNQNLNIKLDSIPQSAFYGETIRLLADNPTILSALGVDLPDNAASGLLQIKDLMDAHGLIEKIEKISKIGGLDGKKIKTELEIARSKIKPIEAKFREIVNEKFAITCFSEKSDSILMWSHYANKHTGFCVEYDFNKCLKLEALVNLWPVLYSLERPSLPMGLFDFTDLNDVKLNNIQDFIPDLTMLLLSKSNIWDYEKEWRIVGLQNQLIDGHLLDLHIVSHIYLGANISDKNAARMLKEVKDIPINRYQIDSSKYRLRLVN